MSASNNLIISEEEAGIRLDKLLAQKFPSQSRTYFQYLIDQGSVLVNGQRIKKREQVSPGDEIEICFILTPEIALAPENIPLDILYEDEDLLAINKPAGMVVHPAAGHPSGTFVNALLYHCQDLSAGNDLRPGIVHRLDKDTSGVLLAAKNLETHAKLIAQFSNREVEKHYTAICLGNPGTCTIDAPIGRHPVNRKEMAVVEEGRMAVSHIKTLGVQDHLALVEIHPVTGRTHQIRVHLKHKNCPILGDKVYGPESANTKYSVDRQLLHARELKFVHPRTKKMLKLEASFPKDILKWINIFNL